MTIYTKKGATDEDLATFNNLIKNDKVTISISGKRLLDITVNIDDSKLNSSKKTQIDTELVTNKGFIKS